MSSMMRNALVIILFVSPSLTLTAQRLFLVDNLNFKFEEHDMQSGTITDHRDLSGFLPYDIYDCITYHPVEKAFYVAYDKYLATDRIMRYDPVLKKYSPVITSGLDKVVDLDFDLEHEKIYFLDKEAKLIKRANMDGSGIEQVGPGQSFLTGWTPVLAVDEAHGLLFFTIGGGSIQYTDLNTWSPNEMPSPVYVAGGRVGDIAIDSDHTWIYWTYNLTQEPSSLNRTNLETFVTETLHSSMEPHNFLSLFGDRVYWSTTGSIIHSVTITGEDLKMEYDVPAGTYAADFVVSDPFTSLVATPTTAGHLDIYPNPASEVISVDAGQNIFEEMIIFSAEGRPVVQMYGTFTATIELPVFQLPAGQYMIQAKRQDGSVFLSPASILR